VAEHRHQAAGLLTLADLAVTADRERFYLCSLSRRAVVEPVLAACPAWHAVPPVVRLLFELPRADRAALSLFDWGAASRLPFLPRVRAGQVILSPARWRIPARELPDDTAASGEWTAGLAQIRQRRGLPDWVSVGSGDQRLRLHLENALDLSVLRAHLRTAGEAIVFTESWAPEDHAWCGGRAHEFVVPLASTAPPLPAPKALARPLVVIGREHGLLPGSGVLSARLYGHPALFDTIVTDCLPELVEGWDDLSRWWFLRYRDPRHHLRLRLYVSDYGSAAARVGRWAAALRRGNLIADLMLDTYRAETARYGGGSAMQAAEQLFAADSEAVMAQLRAEARHPLAMTAASLTDLAGALLGGQQAGFRWFVEHPDAGGTRPLDREARREVLAMTQSLPGREEAVPAGVRQAWHARAVAAERYVAQLRAWGMEPADVTTSLLHIHHNRAHGVDPDVEATTYRLARAAALSYTARRTGAVSVRP
jgi:thiopeptide-type bacteriocin biosynthesis protein